MTNPFSRFLGRRVNDRALNEFRQNWDALETLIVQLFREELDPLQMQTEWTRLRRLTRRQYAQFSDQLDPLWRQALIQGKLAKKDPFLSVTAPAQAVEFVANWDMMQTLPAARESLNKLMVNQRKG